MRTMHFPRMPGCCRARRLTLVATIGFTLGIASNIAPARASVQHAPGGTKAAGTEQDTRKTPDTSDGAPIALNRLIEGDHMVTARPGALLRTGASSRFYPVAIMETPRRLEVLDPTPRRGFLRVKMPDGSPALLPAEACEAIDDRSVRVTRPTRLIALHARGGPEASWKSLLDQPLRPGSRLDVIDVVRDRHGGIRSYIVVAPADAAAWLSLDQIIPLPDPDAPSSVEHDEGDAPQAGGSAVGDAQDDGDTEPEAAQSQADAGKESGSSLMEAMVPPGTEEESSRAGGATVASAPSNLATNTPAPVIEQGGDADATTAREQEALDPAELEALYQRARQSDTFEDELEALLAEHRRTLAALPEDPFNERLRRQLERRIAYLEARIAFRDGPERLAAQRATMPRISEQLREKLERLRAGNEYQLIGRLVISRVYDGKRLPRLYRVRSADALGRTLGYVRPQEGQDLTPYLDRIVGIAGTIEDGPAGSRIVTPERVELLDETP